MCGIFAYAGTRTASTLLVEGLRTLEYRGYDSAGIFVPELGIIKAVGPIDNLAKKILTHGGVAGIAHTRWATHGQPTEENAHPHTDASGNIVLAHNGIIASASSLSEAVRAALLLVRGTYGIAVMEKAHPDEIVVARMGSPIVIGIAPHGHFVASDASALVAHTKDVVFLEDGEVAVVRKDSYKIETLAREARERAPERIAWDAEEAKKSGYDHFMMKEIMEGPEVLQNTLRGRLIVEQGLAKLGGIEARAEELSKLKRITIVACGMSAIVGKCSSIIAMGPCFISPAPYPSA